MSTLEQFIQVHKDFEKYIIKTVDDIDNSRLKEAMVYSLANGGKRVRPLLILATLSVLQANVQRGYSVAAALEYIHTYSLIHDDLPAMDNDDYRRGQLTNHKRFDEATAILAGDALLTHAFGLMIQSDYAPIQKVAMIEQLVSCSGGNGMIGGQMGDMLAQGDLVNLDTVQNIHVLKTGALLQCCVRLGAIMAQVDDDVLQQLDGFAYHFGLAFQIHNDIKDIAQDEVLEKSTYVALLGKDGALDALNREKTLALNCLSELKNYDTTLLADFLTYVQ